MSSAEDGHRQGVKASVSWSKRLTKFVLIVTNVLVLLLEVALAAIFFYLTATDKSLLVNGLGQNVYDLSFGVVCAASVFVILFTVFGLIGTIRENRFFLTIYFSLMFAIVMGEVAAICLTANKIETVRDLIRYNLYHSINLYNSSVTINNAWDLFQKEKQCCGMSDPDSSQPIQPWKVYEIAKVLVNDTKVPESCCVNLEHRHACMAGDEQFIFHKDCFEVLKQLLSEHHAYILGVGLSCLATTVVSLFLTGAFIVLH